MESSPPRGSGSGSKRSDTEKSELSQSETSSGGVSRPEGAPNAVSSVGPPSGAQGAEGAPSGPAEAGPHRPAEPTGRGRCSFWEPRGGHELSREERDLAARAVERDAARDLTWEEMLMDFRAIKDRHPRVLLRRAKKAIPEKWRGRAWALILDGRAERELRTGKRGRWDVEHYFGLRVPDGDDAIRRDVARVEEDAPEFDARGLLYRVLRAWANWDRGFVYVEGMVLPLAMLASRVRDEYEAFWAFRAVMRGPRIGLGALYDDNFAGLKRLNEVWDLLLRKRYPKVARNLGSECIRPGEYTRGYFLWAFMHCEFAPFLRCRVFDRFVAFGVPALVSLGLAFVRVNRRLLAGRDRDCVLPLLQKPECSRWDKVIPAWNHEWLSDTDLNKWSERSQSRKCRARRRLEDAAWKAERDARRRRKQGVLRRDKVNVEKRGHG